MNLSTDFILGANYSILPVRTWSRIAQHTRSGTALRTWSRTCPGTRPRTSRRISSSIAIMGANKVVVSRDVFSYSQLIYLNT